MRDLFRTLVYITLVLSLVNCASLNRVGESDGVYFKDRFDLKSYLNNILNAKNNDVQKAHIQITKAIYVPANTPSNNAKTDKDLDCDEEGEQQPETQSGGLQSLLFNPESLAITSIIEPAIISDNSNGNIAKEELDCDCEEDTDKEIIQGSEQLSSLADILKSLIISNKNPLATAPSFDGLVTGKEMDCDEAEEDPSSALILPSVENFQSLLMSDKYPMATASSSYVVNNVQNLDCDKDMEEASANYLESLFISNKYPIPTAPSLNSIITKKDLDYEEETNEAVIQGIVQALPLTGNLGSLNSQKYPQAISPSFNGAITEENLNCDEDEEATQNNALVSPLADNLESLTLHEILQNMFSPQVSAIKNARPFSELVNEGNLDCDDNEDEGKLTQSITAISPDDNSESLIIIGSSSMLEPQEQAIKTSDSIEENLDCDEDKEDVKTIQDNEILSPSGVNLGSLSIANILDGELPMPHESAIQPLTFLSAVTSEKEPIAEELSALVLPSVNAPESLTSSESISEISVPHVMPIATDPPSNEIIIKENEAEEEKKATQNVIITSPSAVTSGSTLPSISDIVAPEASPVTKAPPSADTLPTLTGPGNIHEPFVLHTSQVITAPSFNTENSTVKPPSADISSSLTISGNNDEIFVPLGSAVTAAPPSSELIHQEDLECDEYENEEEMATTETSGSLKKPGSELLVPHTSPLTTAPSSSNALGSLTTPPIVTHTFPVIKAPSFNTETSTVTLPSADISTSLIISGNNGEVFVPHFSPVTTAPSFNTGSNAVVLPSADISSPLTMSASNGEVFVPHLSSVTAVPPTSEIISEEDPKKTTTIIPPSVNTSASLILDSKSEEFVSLTLPVATAPSFNTASNTVITEIVPVAENHLIEKPNIMSLIWPPIFVTSTMAPPSNFFTGNECKDPNVPDGKHLPYPNDCNKFIHCDRTKAWVKNCGVGLHFNRVYQVCDWPAAAGCI